MGFRNYYILIFLFVPSLARTTSLIYSLKIRRSFISVQSDHKSSVLSLLGLYGIRHDFFELFANSAEKRKYGGLLVNLAHAFDKHFALEATTSIMHESMCFKHATLNGKAHRTGFDDILITSYYNFLPHQEHQCIIYGLVGFPTHKQVNRTETLDTLIGMKCFSVGAGIEGSFTLFKQDKHLFAAIFQARFIHFFSRHMFPAFSCDTIVHPGNFTDLFAALHYDYGKNHFETGYDATLETNIFLQAQQKTKIPFVLRNGIYANYSRTIASRHSLGIGASTNIVRTYYHSNSYNIWAFYNFQF